MVLKTDFTSRHPARAAYAVKDLPKVGVGLFNLASISASVIHAFVTCIKLRFAKSF